MRMRLAGCHSKSVRRKNKHATVFQLLCKSRIPQFLALCEWRLKADNSFLFSTNITQHCLLIIVADSTAMAMTIHFFAFTWFR